MNNFLKSQRGEVVSWTVIVPLIFFIFLFGVVYLYHDRVRAGVAMAAREGAREYGIALEDPALPAWDMARGKVMEVLETEGLIPPESDYLEEAAVPTKGERGVNAEFENDEDTGWVSCTVTYYLPDPLPNLFRLIRGDASPAHYVFTVKGSAKHETVADVDKKGE